MTTTLWKKVLNDLLIDKTRTILVVLSIAIGVFAIGAIAGSYLVFSRDMQENFDKAYPANLTVSCEPFDQDLVLAMRKIPGVETADGRRTLAVRVQVGENEWKSLNLIVISNYSKIKVNRPRLLSGTWPPLRGVLLERSAQSSFPAKEGDHLTIETPDGKSKRLKVTGIVHDVTVIPAFFSGTINGYITSETLETLGETADSRTLYVRTVPGTREELTALSRTIWDKVEKSGHKVYWSHVAPLGEHPLHDIFQAMLFLLSTLGIFSLVSSGFLLINTITAILTQHTKQIGIMKAIGGTTGQIFRVYIVTVLCYSVLALVVAVPLGALGAYGLTFFQADLANVDINGFYFSPEVIALQILLAVAVPLIASLVPLRRGVGISVREAIGFYGIGEKQVSRIGKWIDRQVDELVAACQNISRPVRLSLRNTFRRKGRLMLTLSTLILAGTVFIAVCSVNRSIGLTTNASFNYYQYDVGMSFTDSQRIEKVERAALQVPGIVSAEGWGYTAARIMRNGRDENDSEDVFIYAMAAQTKVISPELIEGRWLLPDDENALVVNTEVLKKYGEIHIGDRLPIKIDNRKTEWVVVGIVKGVMTGPFAYVNFPYFGQVTQHSGQVRSVIVTTDYHDQAYQTSIVRQLEEHMKKTGIKVSSLTTTQQQKSHTKAQFDVLVVFLGVMAGLLAIVGALGLAGTMSINVIERTREIGVMRAIGASSLHIFKIIMVEGICIGLMSWLIGLLLSMPISQLMSDQVGNLFTKAPLIYEFSVAGAILWFVIVVVISIVATWLPARRAMRVSVRESLSYE